MFEYIKKLKTQDVDDMEDAALLNSQSIPRDFIHDSHHYLTDVLQCISFTFALIKNLQFHSKTPSLYQEELLLSKMAANLAE